jgi:hypothetical protein
MDAPKTDQRDDNLQKAIVANLNVQWQDHFHMRDQTWKVVQSCLLFFAAALALELKGVPTAVRIVSYSAVIVSCIFGVLISAHHRRRQREKFKLIRVYERELRLAPLMDELLGQKERLNTASFVVVLLVAIVALSVVLVVLAIARG